METKGCLILVSVLLLCASFAIRYTDGKDRSVPAGAVAWDNGAAWGESVTLKDLAAEVFARYGGVE